MHQLMQLSWRMVTHYLITALCGWVRVTQRSRTWLSSFHEQQLPLIPGRKEYKTLPLLAISHYTSTLPKHNRATVGASPWESRSIWYTSPFWGEIRGLTYKIEAKPTSWWMKPQHDIHLTQLLFRSNYRVRPSPCWWAISVLPLTSVELQLLPVLPLTF